MGALNSPWFSALVNLAAALIAAASLIVAVALLVIARQTYLDARESGDKQIKLMAASRDALQAVVDASGIQIKALDDSRAAMKSVAQILSAQEERAQEQLKRKPMVDLWVWGLHDNEWKRGVTADYADPIRGTLNLQNVGSASLFQPKIAITAIPASVRLEDDDPLHAKRADTFRLVYLNLGLTQIPPASEHVASYMYPFQVRLPPGLSFFELEVLVYGENMPAKTRRIKVKVNRADIPTASPMK